MELSLEEKKQGPLRKWGEKRTIVKMLRISSKAYLPTGVSGVPNGSFWEDQFGGPQSSEMCRFLIVTTELSGASWRIRLHLVGFIVTLVL